MKTAGDEPLEGANVLVVEDDALLAFEIIKVLHQAGANVIGPAMSLERAIELAESEPVTCAVLDVKLRDGLVFPAAEVLRKKGAGIVFYTGQGDPEAIKRDWPQAEVLFKPSPIDHLVRTVAAVCARKKRRHKWER